MTLSPLGDMKMKMGGPGFLRLATALSCWRATALTKGTSREEEKIAFNVLLYTDPSHWQWSTLSHYWGKDIIVRRQIYKKYGQKQIAQECSLIRSIWRQCYGQHDSKPFKEVRKVGKKIIIKAASSSGASLLLLPIQTEVRIFIWKYVPFPPFLTYPLQIFQHPEQIRILRSNWLGWLGHHPAQPSRLSHIFKGHCCILYIR